MGHRFLKFTSFHDITTKHVDAHVASTHFADGGFSVNGWLIMAKDINGNEVDLRCLTYDDDGCYVNEFLVSQKEDSFRMYPADGIFKSVMNANGETFVGYFVYRSTNRKDVIDVDDYVNCHRGQEVNIVFPFEFGQEFGGMLI